MSEEKRQRIRTALLDQRRRGYPAKPRTPLDRERLRALAGLDHVTGVTPAIYQGGWAMFNGQSHQIMTGSATVDNEFCLKRLVAGEFFHTPDERVAVVSEFLCYEFGIVNDADLAALIGKKLRLEFRSQPQTAGLHVYLTKADGDPMSHEESLAMEKVQMQLPAVLERMDLTAKDKDALQTALHGTPRRPEVVQVEELTIAGVLRQATEADREGGWNQLNTEADVVLPVGTAEEILFSRPEMGNRSADYVKLSVDREENVRGVAEQVRAMGLQAHAPLEFIDRERLIYLLIFSTMSCVAGVALLIAALGIANTMLMSVLERTREIGIFKAVGAGDWHVQAIFLIEGACIGLVGGVLGLLLAWAGSFPADAWIRSMISRDLKIDLQESLFVFPPWLTIGVVLFTGLVTTLAAVYPARRAARVEPLKALRHE
jgi:putative ABC transport system permease protein